MDSEDHKERYYYLILQKKEFTCTETEISRPIRLTKVGKMLEEGYTLKEIKGLVVSSYELLPFTYDHPQILKTFLEEQEKKGVKHFNLTDIVKKLEKPEDSLLELDLVQ
ncbi:MAG: hypothetical protein Q7S56_02110 [Nanoarchaeota archaeon]|nr:hypothetical protein [Nanoarchaeota archaeon]